MATSLRRRLLTHPRAEVVAAKAVVAEAEAEVVRLARRPVH
jgi:hypothetical protein